MCGASVSVSRASLSLCAHMAQSPAAWAAETGAKLPLPALLEQLRLGSGAAPQQVGGGRSLGPAVMKSMAAVAAAAARGRRCLPLPSPLCRRQHQPLLWPCRCMPAWWWRWAACLRLC